VTATPILAVRALDVKIAGINICTALDFTVETGQCWAILGRNGAGKTTLLATLGGLRSASAGVVEIEGRALSSFTPRELARLRALLPQDDSDPHLGRWQWEGAEDLRIARGALAAVDMADAETRDVRTLSGGERRRITLAAVLAQEPRLFLLDEPSSHLDLAHQVAVLDSLAGLVRSEGRAMIMALHDVNLAARYCDHVLLLDRGMANTGPAEELLTSERLSALYGVPLRSLREDGRSIFVI